MHGLGWRHPGGLASGKAVLAGERVDPGPRLLELRDQLQDGASWVWEAMDNVAGTLGRDGINEIMSQAMAPALSSKADEGDLIDQNIGI